MRVVVRPAELDAAAARVAAQAACLNVLLVAAHLDAAAAAVPGTQLARAAYDAAERLRAALSAASLQMATAGDHLSAAAERYELVDRRAMRSERS